MYQTVKQQVKHLTKEEFRILKYLCHIAKNLANEAIYNVRQYYFREKKYLNGNQNWRLLKGSVNYQKLQVHLAQQVIRKTDDMFKSFFALLKLKREGKYSGNVNIPKYLPKDGFMTLRITDFNLNDGKLTIPYSYEYRRKHKRITVKVPEILRGRKIKVVRIVPKANARYFEIQYVYEIQETQSDLDQTKALAIDLGISNLAACVTENGKSFIIDGRKVKSINQWFNKENARLQSIIAKQKHKTPSRRQTAILRRRSNQVNDYLNKTARLIINFCLANGTGKIVLGYNTDFRKANHLGHVIKQTFMQIPFGRLKERLRNLSERYGIEFHEQEESYTSKASFWDKDEIPVYNPVDKTRHKFSGRRIHRGLYETSAGLRINADVNGALNILRKSNVVSIEGLYGRGELDTPVRIRVV